MLKAYQCIDRALDIDEAIPRPYLGRLTFALQNTLVPLTVDGGVSITEQAIETRVYRFPEWHKGLAKEISLLRQALTRARKAVEQAPSHKTPFYCHCRGSSPAMSCKTYARIQMETIEIVWRVKMSMLHFVQAAKAETRRSLSRIIAEEGVNTRGLIAVMRAHAPWVEGDVCVDLLKALRKKLKAMGG